MAVHVRPLIANELTDGCSVCLELDEDRPQVKVEVVQGFSTSRYQPQGYHTKGQLRRTAGGSS